MATHDKEDKYDDVEGIETDPTTFRAEVAQYMGNYIGFGEEIAPKEVSRILKALQRKIVSDIGLTHERQRELIEMAINSTPEGATLSSEKRVQERASINKNFFQQPTMTWKKFVASMKLLRFLKFRISIMAVHASGEVTEHGLWINLREPDEQDANTPPAVRLGTLKSSSERPVSPPNAWSHSGHVPAAPQRSLLEGLVKDYSKDNPS